MPTNILIVLERENGEHNLHFGEYNLDMDNHIMYIGIGDFGGGGGVTPVGQIVITQNGEYDVRLFASAKVEVEAEQPTDTLTITANGIYDVIDKAFANVQVVSDTLKFFVDFIDNQLGEFTLSGFGSPEFYVTDITVVT